MSDTKAAPKNKLHIAQPPKYKVTIFNDDFTTQELVVEILKHIFKKGPAEAETLMLRVHTGGAAVVGVYTKDIAETKAEQATDYARENDSPLLITVSPE